MRDRRVHGFSTIDVLIAGAVLSFGALAVGTYLQAQGRLSDASAIQSQFDSKCKLAQVYMAKQATHACREAKKMPNLAWATSPQGGLSVQAFFEKSLLHNPSDGGLPFKLKEKTVFLIYDASQSVFELHNGAKCCSRRYVGYFR